MKKIAVCLYKFFPFGGLARDAVRILSLCQQKGYAIDIYVMECHGDVPEGFNIEIIETKGFSNHKKVANFIEQFHDRIAKQDYDLVIGFNKIPDLDLYYAADPCYLDRVKSQPDYSLMKHNPRVKFYSACEKAVFKTSSKTVTLMISEVQRQLFKKQYGTQDERLIMLPPGIDPSRKRPEDWQQQRSQLRDQFGIKDDQFLLLMVGTGFKTKGVDRSISALANLPTKLKSKTRLFIIGEGSTTAYEKQAKELGINERVRFFGGRDDIPQFLLAADLLVHPARKENTGTVILETIVAGLPALVTDVCGYASHVSRSHSGLLMSSPFKQDEFDLKLITLLNRKRLTELSEHAIDYATTEDLYSMPEKAAGIISEMLDSKQSMFREMSH